MSFYPIEYGIPLPRRRGGGRDPDKTGYPFEQLNVDGSFFVPLIERNTSAVAAACSEYTRTLPEIELVTRALDEDPVYKTRGTRVWRIR